MDRRYFANVFLVGIYLKKQASKILLFAFKNIKRSPMDMN